MALESALGIAGHLDRRASDRILERWAGEAWADRIRQLVARRAAAVVEGSYVPAEGTGTLAVPLRCTSAFDCAGRLCCGGDRCLGKQSCRGNAGDLWGPELLRPAGMVVVVLL